MPDWAWGAILGLLLFYWGIIAFGRKAKQREEAWEKKYGIKDRRSDNNSNKREQ